MTHRLRVAVIGAGPAGTYVADALVFDRERDVRVDLFDRLPTPFGLLRYGVAPDHLKMKSLQRVLQRTIEDDRVRFLGNVEVGNDVTVDELRSAYHAVVYAHGAPKDKRLGIEGEDLAGSVSATDLVAWYSGHPDARADFSLTESSVAVIGVGNVAIDVARILLKQPAELRSTDIPTEVLDVLEHSNVQDVHVFGRRGPAQAKWTLKELRELGELDGVEVRVDPADLVLDEASQRAVDADPNLSRCREVLHEWAARQPTGAARRLHVHGFSTPVHIRGTSRVEALRLERRPAQGEVSVVDVPVQLVLRSIGYLGSPLAGVPFNAQTGTVPSLRSRVARPGQTQPGQTRPGEYVCGWIGRGPQGVLGTNKADAQDCVDALLDDAPVLVARDVPETGVDALLLERGVEIVDLGGWARIDASECRLGADQGRARAKIATREALLAAAR